MGSIPLVTMDPPAPMPFPNQQPAEKQNLDQSGILEIFSCFATIQGEGPFAGEPSVFVRTSGCNLQCELCDTDYTSIRQKYTPDDLSTLIAEIMPPKASLVVITGGEPLRQNLVPLLRRLFDKHYRVQIETNGTLDLDGLHWLPRAYLTVVCSPKTGKINRDLTSCIDALKYVISAGKVDPEDGLPLDSLGTGVRVQRPWPAFRGTVFVQPCDSQSEQENKANMQEAINSCMRFGYRLSLQLHKIVGLP